MATRKLSVESMALVHVASGGLLGGYMALVHVASCLASVRPIAPSGFSCFWARRRIVTETGDEPGRWIGGRAKGDSTEWGMGGG